MKYTGYGTFLGAALALLVFVYYGYFHDVEYTALMPYLFLSMLMYFFLVGYYIGHKTCSFKNGLKAGVIAGVVSMIIVSIAMFAVHHIFYYYETIGEPEKLAGFSSSGLLSMQRFLVYEDIRLSLLRIIGGSLFAAFAAGMGSFTAVNILKNSACRNPNIPMKGGVSI